MANYVNYKNIISTAISHFNQVQTSLAGLGAKRTNGVDLISAPGAADASTLVPTTEFGTIISTQLQLKSVGNLNINTATAGTAISLDYTNGDGFGTTYKTITLKAGSASVTAKSTASGALSGSWNDTTKKFTVKNADATVDITPVTTEGWIKSNAGSTGTITLTPASLEIAQAQFEVSGANVKVKANGQGYINAGATVGTIPNATLSLSGGNISVSNALDLNETDGTNAGVNVAASLLNTGTDGSLITTTEPTEGYYLSFKASSKAAGSSTVGLTIGSAGYVSSSNKPTDKTISVVDNADVTKYFPVKTASLTMTGSKAATAPTAKLNSQTGIAGATVSTTAGTHSVRLTLTAPATTGIAVNSVASGGLTTGYLGDKSQVTATASTTAATSNAYYVNIPGSTTTTADGKVTISAGYTSGQTIDLSTSASGSLTYTSSIATTVTEVDGITETTDSMNIFSETLTDDIKAGDYFTVTATGHGNLIPGYIAANSNAATKKLYMPKAVLEYIQDNETTLVQVKKAGYLPAGILSDIANIGGTIDYAELNPVSFSAVSYSSSDNTYKWTGTLSVKSPGYLKSGTTSSGTLSVAAASITGGALSSAASTGTANANNTISVSGDYFLASGTNTRAISLTGTKTAVTRAKVSTTAGYTTAKDAIASSSYIVGTTAKTVYLKEAVVAAAATTISFSAVTTSPSNKGEAILYTTTADAGSNYVTVSASGSGKVNVSSAGWIDAQTATSTSGTGTGYLRASVPTYNCTTTATDGFTETTFNSATGEMTSGNKKISTSSTVTVTNIKDTYALQNVAQGTVSNGSVTLNKDATGSDVDLAAQSLLQRMLGLTYTEVE